LCFRPFLSMTEKPQLAAAATTLNVTPVVCDTETYLMMYRSN
jgi:hypothetical protein